MPQLHSQPAIALYSAAQVRELDRLAIEARGIPGIRLMKAAGRATFDTFVKNWPAPALVTVYCGAGNNGGDGYIVAALAAAAGFAVRVVQVAAPEKLTGDAHTAYEFALRESVPMETLDHPAPVEGVIVDALLGTGLSGDVRGDFVHAVEAINGAGLPVVSVDIPSGLCADTGKVLGCAVAADTTVTYIGRKRGLYTGRGPAFVGDVVFDDLSVPDDIYQEVVAEATLSDWERLQGVLNPRPADAHKGLYGHVMIIGGDLGYGGAVAMAAEAALRTGAGLVSVATRSQHIAGINARCPEVMAIGVASGQELEPLLDRPSVLVVGPGLGSTPWSEQMLQKALAAGLPMVLDADALNIIARGRVGGGADFARSVFTPHPGEAARLLNCSIAEIQNDRFKAVKTLAATYGATCLLKGAGTLVCGGTETTRLCPYGNPGMASGGMGDVLSGVIGSLLAQGVAPLDATELGACLHGLAGDDAAVAQGQRGLSATDLMPYLRKRSNESGS